MIHQPSRLIWNSLNERRRNYIKTALSIRKLLGIRQDNEDPKNALLVTGAPRSGTTWLGEVVAHSVGGRIIFEPMQFEFTQFRALRDKPLFVPWGEDCADLEKALRRVFSGKLIPNYQVDASTCPGVYSTRVVKDLRLSFSLDFVARTFPEVAIMHIVRHPLAVLRSQLQIQSGNQLEISRRYNESLRSHDALWSALGSEVTSFELNDDVLEYKLFGWCVLQKIVELSIERNPKVRIVKYEDAKERPEETFSELTEALERDGWNIAHSPLQILDKPSRTTIESEKKSVEIGRTTGKWRGDFSEHELQRFREVVASFNLATEYEF